MNKLSPQSEKYLRQFRGLIKLYPRKHQQEYADAIVQLLRDQLEDAERAGDPHIRREVFMHAVLGIPGSLAKEYMDAVVHGDIRSLWEDSGLDRWRTTNYFFFFFLLVTQLIAVLRLDGTAWVVISSLSAFAAACTLLVSVFLDTRRLFLSFLVLVAGLGTLFVGNTVVSGLALSTLNGNGAPAFSQLASFSFLLLTSFLIPYALANLFHAHPERYRRVILANLSDKELQQFQEGKQKRRRRNLQVISVLFSIFVGMNLAGLYDPEVSHTDLDLPVRTIPAAQNMFTDLASFPEVNDSISAQLPKLQALYLNKWDGAQAAEALKGKEEMVNLVMRVAQKPDYQEPSFADLSKYKTAEEAVSVPYTSLGGLRNATALTLVQTETLRRQGDVAGALERTLAVIRIGDAIQVSQGTVISNMVGNAIRKEGLAVLETVLTDNTLTQDQKIEVQEDLAGLHPTKTGIAAALKAEYYLGRTIIETARDGGAQFFYPSSSFSLYSLPVYLPFFFQPNRTVAEVSNRLRTKLSYLDASCENLKIPAEEPKFHGFPFQIGLRTLQYNGIGKQFVEYGYQYNSFLESRCTYDGQAERVSELLMSSSSR